MLKKEFSDALRKFLECVSLLIAVPLALLFDRFIIHSGWKFLEVFNVVFIISIVCYPVYSGATIFQSEKKNRAFEYMFSLPIQRWKIILYKIATRIAFLLLLLVVSVFFSVFKDVFLIGFNLIIVFLIAVFFSLHVSSVISVIVGIIFMFYLYVTDAHIILFLLWKLKLTSSTSLAFIPEIFSAAFLLIPLGFTFWLTFKNLDVKSPKLHMKYYLLIALPSIAILVSFAFLFFKKYLAWLQTA